MKLKRNTVYRISFACDTPGPEIEEGEFEGLWDGTVDMWGKLTFIQVPAGPPYYLFKREIIEAESP